MNLHGLTLLSGEEMVSDAEDAIAKNKMQYFHMSASLQSCTKE